MTSRNTSSAKPLLGLIDLSRRARHADESSVLRFLAVNETHSLAAYRQAALWFDGLGVQALSGLIQIETNAPYVLWLNKVCAYFSVHRTAPGSVTREDLPDDLSAEWDDWLPQYGIWLPIAAAAETPMASSGGLLLVRDLPWIESEQALLVEWMDIWRHAWLGIHQVQAGSWKQFLLLFRKQRVEKSQVWWKRRWLRLVLVVLLVAIIPVRLTVLAPGELVPANPAVIRAPLDGVLDVFHVQPNQLVRKGEPLFGFDEALIRSRLEVAEQALLTAEVEYRQTAQQALLDPKSKALLAALTGRIEEKRAEASYTREQLDRALVVSPQDGIALFDDPSEWIGRPVVIGERIMRIAVPHEVEIEAWVPLADAIPLDSGTEISLYLNSSPLAPVHARLRYMAHDAIERPDGAYAYRLRASLLEPTDHRVGLKGTARIDGRRVPLVYWVMRRPVASVRTMFGW